MALPVLPAEAAAREAEREYMAEQPAAMAERYERTIQRVKENFWKGRSGHTLSAAETRSFRQWERRACLATEHTESTE